MGKKDNLVSAILSLLIIGILSITVYFSLDLFGIVDIPSQYSLAQKLNSIMSKEIVAETNIEIITEENIDEWINQDVEVIEEVKITQTAQTTEIENTYVVETNIQEENVENTIVNTEVVTTVNTNNVVNKMYYSQLDIYGRIIYDAFYDNKDKLKSGTFIADFDTSFNDLLHTDTGAEVLEQAFQQGLNAMLFDHPEIFYMDITKIYMSTETITFGPLKTYKVSIGPLDGEDYLLETFHNEEIVDIAISEIERIKQEVKETIVANDDTYTKIKKVHDYLINLVEYDQTLIYSNIYTAYGALASKKAVCEGYAKAFKYILDDLNIPCIIVCGIAQNSSGETESHAWNYVKLNDLWYAVDCTWDDPVVIGSGYISSEIYERYFLVGSDEFFEDHEENGIIVTGANFIYPTISKENYR